MGSKVSNKKLASFWGRREQGSSTERNRDLTLVGLLGQCAYGFGRFSPSFILFYFLKNKKKKITISIVMFTLIYNHDINV
jgi:hypothetical protein